MTSTLPPEFLFWLLQDVQSLIEAAALKNPVLICLDDLHWGGTSLSVAMRQLPLRLSSLPVAWVMAFRPGQGLHQMQHAEAELIESGAELIRLAPLNREAVAQVATDVLGAEADDELLQKAETGSGAIRSCLLSSSADSRTTSSFRSIQGARRSPRTGCPIA